ncbi:MAG: hypothetical protein ABIO92_05490 [Chloroflexia bacterium]
MRSRFRSAQDTQADPARVTSGREAHILWIGGAFLVAGCVAYLCLFQSSSLWARAIPLPGDEDGPFGALRRIFPVEWLQASRGSELGLLNSVIYLLILALLFATYWLTLRSVVRLQKQRNAALSVIDWHGNRLLWQILLITALALFVLLWLPGTQSADLHSYIWYGRILATFGDNPLVHIPLEYASRDAGGWLELVYWKDVPSVYGPVWVLLAGGIAWLGNLISNSDTGPHLLGHKILASSAHLVNIALMWRVSGLVAHSRWPLPDSDFMSNAIERQHGAKLVATLVYAWCPLALIEFGGNGHNDVLMLTGIMTALWLHLTGRWRLAAVAFALAALVKVAALLLLPGYLWLLFWDPPLVRDHKAKRKWQGADIYTKSKILSRLPTVAQALLAVAATWTVFYLPFWEGPETLHPLTGGPASTLFTNSLAAMLRYKGAEWLHALATAYGWEALTRQSVDAVRGYLEWPLRLLTLSVTVLVALAATWRGRTFPRMVQGWGWMLFVYLTLGAVWFWPWYVSWLILPVTLLGRGRLFNAVQILCFTSMTLYAIYPQLPSYMFDLVYYRSLLVVAPALIYVGVCRRWKRLE